MTREEAIKELKEDIELYIPLHGTIDDVDRDLPDGRLITALEMAIKALEQEPCDVFDRYGNYKYPSDVKLTEPNTATSMPYEDAISRQAAIDTCLNIYFNGYKGKDLLHDIKKLPPVNPQPKTGHWIHFAQSDDCSECRWSTGKYISPSKYCPNCGAKMVDVPDTNIGKMTKIPTGLESEDKE